MFAIQDYLLPMMLPFQIRCKTVNNQKVVYTYDINLKYIKREKNICELKRQTNNSLYYISKRICSSTFYLSLSNLSCSIRLFYYIECNYYTYLSHCLSQKGSDKHTQTGKSHRLSLMHVTIQQRTVNFVG